MELRSLLFSSAGRIGRMTYWLTALGFVVAESILGGFARSADHELVYLASLVGLAMTVMNILVTIKRAHDRDRSGWFLLVAFIPFIGGLWLLIELGFLRGTVGGNRFGPDPVGSPLPPRWA
jgi:uncharacterized membrane protein YhaH (DUF805 family)